MLQLLLQLVPIIQIQEQLYLVLFILNQTFKPYLVLTVVTPDLEEESADTTTIGLVWTPSYVEGLAVSLDYYQIEIDNVISSVSATRLINECYESTNFQMRLNVMRMKDFLELVS